MIDAWKVTVKLDFFLCFCFSFSLSARPLRESSSSFSAPTRAFLLNNFNNLRWLIFPPFSKLHILIYFVACEKCWSRKLASACGWLGMTFLGKSLIETFRHDSLDDECREGGEMQQSKQITNDEWLWLEMEMQGSLSRMQNRLCVLLASENLSTKSEMHKRDLRRDLLDCISSLSNRKIIHLSARHVASWNSNIVETLSRWKII